MRHSIPKDDEHVIIGRSISGSKWVLESGLGGL